jgi:hypothetical protein
VTLITIISVGVIEVMILRLTELFIKLHAIFRVTLLCNIYFCGSKLDLKCTKKEKWRNTRRINVVHRQFDLLYPTLRGKFCSITSIYEYKYIGTN